MSQGRKPIAYSTGPAGSLPGGIQACRKCGHWPCRCEPQSSAAPAKQALVVRREKAGRKGKTVTTVAPLQLSRADAQSLLAELKKLCGCGGAIDVVTGPEGARFVLEVQGDHVDKVVADLNTRGYRARPG